MGARPVCLDKQSFLTSSWLLGLYCIACVFVQGCKSISKAMEAGVGVKGAAGRKAWVW